MRYEIALEGILGPKKPVRLFPSLDVRALGLATKAMKPQSDRIASEAQKSRQEG